MSDNDLVLKLARVDPEVWFSVFATIRNKRGKMEKAPKPNVLQRRMFAHYRKCCIARKPCLIIVLKPRQTGASTAAQAIIYHHQRRLGSLNGALMGDIAGTSDKVFEIFRRFAENDSLDWGDGLSASFKEGGNQSDDIDLANGSHYSKETAGSKNAGRGGTIQVASMTEVGFWPSVGGNDPALAFLNSFYESDPVSLAIADSTPNGPQGWFFNTCTKPNDWEFIFAAWFEFEENVRPFESDADRDEFLRTMSEDEKQEQERYRVSLEQLNWRRRTLRDKCDGNIDKFRQEYPSDPMECFLKSSRPRFHVPSVESMIRRSTDPDVGYVTEQGREGVTWVPDPQGGTVQRWEPPRHGCRYLIAVDTCTGEDQQIGHGTADPDWHAVHVWRAPHVDADSGQQLPAKLVARHKSRLDIDVVADEVAALSAYYGNCLIVPEVNNSGLAMVKRLVEKDCFVFQRRTVNSQTSEVDRSYGWRTDSVTRKTVIDHLAAEVREGRLDIPSAEALAEFRSFVVNPNGRPEAMRGHHDDDVLAAAIAVYNLSGATECKAPKRRKITQAMLRKNPKLLCPDGFFRAMSFAFALFFLVGCSKTEERASPDRPPLLLQQAVTGGSMSPTFTPGVYLAEAAPFERLQSGDVVIFWSESHRTYVFHRIQYRHKQGWAAKGDANPTYDLTLVTPETYTGIRLVSPPVRLGE
jgi:signal peptidase I